jgi:uncharacterized metal-binding protein
LWYPYQAFFAHRSRWSHGLLFGTLFRIVYFMGVLTLFGFLLIYIYRTAFGGNASNLMEFTKTWTLIGEFVRARIGEHTFLSVFIGLWLGAASHTFTDIAGSFVKTGGSGEFI